MNDIRWLNAHIIDLTKTPWDKDKSDPAKGKYVFTGPKVYHKRGHDSPWKIGFFIRYAPPYADVTMQEAMFGITPVRASEMLAMPEGVPPNAEGYFQVGDVILAKEPRMAFLKRRQEAVGATDIAKKAAFGKFEQDADESGSKAEVYDI